MSLELFKEVAQEYYFCAELIAVVAAFLTIMVAYTEIAYDVAVDVPMMLIKVIGTIGSGAAFCGVITGLICGQAVNAVTTLFVMMFVYAMSGFLTSLHAN